MNPNHILRALEGITKLLERVPTRKLISVYQYTGLQTKPALLKKFRNILDSLGGEDREPD